MTQQKPEIENISPKFLERLIELNDLDMEFYRKLREWYMEKRN